MDVEVANSLVSKHQKLVELVFLGNIECMDEAFHCEECGWYYMRNFYSILRRTPTKEEIEQAFDKELADVEKYHMETCGCQNDQGEKIGCKDECDVKRRGIQKIIGSFSDQEAEMLRVIEDGCNDQTEWGGHLPYTGENMFKYYQKFITNAIN